MNIKHLFLTLIVSFFSNAYGMQEEIQDYDSTYQTDDGMAPKSD